MIEKSAEKNCAYRTMRYGVVTTLIAMACFAFSSLADSQIIESSSLGANNSDYVDSAFANSTLKSDAPGCSKGVGSRYGWTNSCTIILTPSHLTNAGGLYLMEITHGGAGSVSATIMVRLSIFGGVWTNMVEQTSTNEIWTTAFQRDNPNIWERVGVFALDPDVTAPTIICTTTNTDLHVKDARFYSDAYRFTAIPDPCLNVPQLSTVNGPLYAGQTRLSVPGVAGEATKLTAYAYRSGSYVLLGSKETGVVYGLNIVDFDPGMQLEKGDVVVVTQWTNWVESCRATTGPVVGGGRNPRIRVSLSLWENSAFSGPIGFSAGTPPAGSTFKFLGATNTFASGFANAPLGGKVFDPSADWQTVSFWRDDPENPDPVWGWTVQIGSTNLEGNFAALDSIAFAMEDASDTGPFEIYLDNIMNGTNLIQGFENATNAQYTVMFREPSYSSSTDNSLLSQAPGRISPNLSMVTNGIVADLGENCAIVSWQWNSASPSYWLRLVAAGSGTPYPMVDLSQPISFRMLLLPPGISPRLRAPDQVLQYSVSGRDAFLYWTNGVLQSSTEVSGPFTDVPDAYSPYWIAPESGTAYYRLRGI